MDQLFEQVIPYNVVKNPRDNISVNSTQHYTRNMNCGSADFLTQNILLDCVEMSNIRYIQISNLEYGCQLSVYVSECRNGPYITIHNNKFFPRSKLRQIPLYSLPCRFIRIVIHKGVHIQNKQITLIGSGSEQLANMDQSNDEFKMLVTNPQRILY